MKKWSYVLAMALAVILCISQFAGFAMAIIEDYSDYSLEELFIAHETADGASADVLMIETCRRFLADPILFMSSLESSSTANRFQVINYFWFGIPQGASRDDFLAAMDVVKVQPELSQTIQEFIRYLEAGMLNNWSFVPNLELYRTQELYYLAGWYEEIGTDNLAPEVNRRFQEDLETSLHFISDNKGWFSIDALSYLIAYDTDVENFGTLRQSLSPWKDDPELGPLVDKLEQTMVRMETPPEPTNPPEPSATTEPTADPTPPTESTAPEPVPTEPTPSQEPEGMNPVYAFVSIAVLAAIGAGVYWYQKKKK